MSWAEEFSQHRARLMSAHMQPIEREDVTVEELESWLNEDLACEGDAHPYGTYGHTPDAPAEYRIVAPCCGRAVHQCATRVSVIMHTDVANCLGVQGGCGATFPTAALKVVPI